MDNQCSAVKEFKKSTVIVALTTTPGYYIKEYVRNGHKVSSLLQHLNQQTGGNTLEENRNVYSYFLELLASLGDSANEYIREFVCLDGLDFVQTFELLNRATTLDEALVLIRQGEHKAAVCAYEQ